MLLEQAVGEDKKDTRVKLNRRRRNKECVRAELVELQKTKNLLLGSSDLLSPYLQNSAPDSPAWKLFHDCRLEFSPADTQWLRALAVANASTRIVFDDDEANDERARLSMVTVSGRVPSHHPFTADMTSTIDRKST